MEYDINKIRALCDRYFDGETTVDEEIMVKTYFIASADVPSDLRAVKAMICGMEDASKMTYSPAPANPARTFGNGRLGRIIWGTVAAAASVAICISLFNREIYGYDADGKAITDPHIALESTECLALLGKLETTIDIAELLTQEMENNN
jgi:hypothetical protein